MVQVTGDQGWEAIDLPEVAFLGVGSMGKPMVERLLAADVAVRVHARKAEVKRELADLGAVVADSMADAVKDAELCLLCLFSGAQVEEVALGDGGVLAELPAGAVLAVHTTVTPQTLDRLSAEAAGRGVSIVDAPISGTADAIRAGRLTVLFGGQAGAIDRCEPVVSAYAGTMLRVGDVGVATKVKLVNNLTFAAHAQIAESAVALGERLGIAGADLVAALGACSGDSVVFSHLRAGGVDVLGKAVRYLRKDVAAVEEVATASGIDLGLLRSVVQEGPLPLTD